MPRVLGGVLWGWVVSYGRGTHVRPLFSDAGRMCASTRHVGRVVWDENTGAPRQKRPPPWILGVGLR